MLRQIVHIGLALLLFISTTGVVVNKHFCQNELKSVALFVKAKACHTKQVKKPCPIHGYMMVDAEESDDKGCCDDETEIIKSEEDQIASTFLQEIALSPSLSANLLVVLQLERPQLDRQTIHYLNYKPPLLICEHPSELQIFLC
ncbi:MAG: hypothetical protein HRU41_09875 [Saprospiraceae bacterium]|nr:hypothetical protein [Saprospiraceae bacterium]